MSVPPPSGPGDRSHFEQALIDAMSAATRETPPATLDTARLHRRAQLWRSASVAAFVASGVLLVAGAAASLVGGNASRWLDPAAGPMIAQPSPTGTIDTAVLADSTATALSDASSLASATTDPTEAAPAASLSSAPAAEDQANEPGAGGPVGEGRACIAVPDGSDDVSDLVLSTARRQVDDWLAAQDESYQPPPWLKDPSEEDLRTRLAIAEAIRDVERGDIVDCAGQLDYASSRRGSLEATVEREVAEALEDTLPRSDGGDDGDDDDDDGDDGDDD